MNLSKELIVLTAIGFCLILSVAGRFSPRHYHGEEEDEERGYYGEETRHHRYHHGHYVDENDIHVHRKHHRHHHGHHHHSHRMKCQGQDITITHETQEARKICLAELQERLNATSHSHHYGNYYHHLQHHHKRHHAAPKMDLCYVACKFEKLNLVENGKLDMDNVEDYIDLSFPEVARDAVVQAISDCSSKHEQTLSTRDKCKSYVPLLQCIFRSVYKVCRPKRVHHHRRSHRHYYRAYAQ